MNTQRKCDYCFKSFTAFTEHTRFCSNACRVSYHNLPKRLAEKADKAIDYVAQMQELAEKYPHLIPLLSDELHRVHLRSRRVNLFLLKLPGLQETK